MDKDHLEFKKLQRGYRSLEHMAEFLRRFPGFEDVHRSTLSRWFKHPTRRTALAIDILKGGVTNRSVTLAYPQIIEAVPAIMMMWAPTPGSRPYGSLLKNHGVDLRGHVTRGQQTLQLICSDGVDLAVAAAEENLTLPDHVVPLCTVANSFLHCAATTQIRNVGDLHGKVVGVDGSPGMVENVREVLKKRGVQPKRVEVLDSQADCTVLLVSRTVEAVFGGALFVENIEQAFRYIRSSPIQLHKVDLGHLNPMRLILFANFRRADPSAVRAYLWCLLECIAYAESHKDKASFHGDVASLFSISSNMARAVLSSSTFGLRDEGTTGILTLWHREVSQL
jgi:hypothetical protein